jgi:hypothetical protein
MKEMLHPALYFQEEEGSFVEIKACYNKIRIAFWTHILMAAEVLMLYISVTFSQLIMIAYLAILQCYVICSGYVVSDDI